MSSEASPSRSEPAEELDFSSPIPGTWALIAAMVAAHVAGAVSDWQLGLVSLADGLIWTRDARLLASVGGQDAGLVLAGDAYRLWTSVLVHTSGLHLLVNASAVYALGRLLEPWIGGRRVWAWFWLGGVLGSLASLVAEVPRSNGASGGAYALLAAAVVLGSEARPRLVPEDARLVGPVLWAFVAVNLVLSVALPFVDLVAHLAGLFVGLVLAGAVGRHRRGVIGALEWVWLLACAVLLGLGWGAPDIWRGWWWLQNRPSLKLPVDWIPWPSGDG